MRSKETHTRFAPKLACITGTAPEEKEDAAEMLRRVLKEQATDDNIYRNVDGCLVVNFTLWKVRRYY